MWHLSTPTLSVWLLLSWMVSLLIAYLCLEAVRLSDIAALQQQLLNRRTQPVFL